MVHAHGLELQVYRPWQLEPCVAAPEAQVRSSLSRLRRVWAVHDGCLAVVMEVLPYLFGSLFTGAQR